jgi:hypothetical protein
VEKIESKHKEWKLNNNLLSMRKPEAARIRIRGENQFTPVDTTIPFAEESIAHDRKLDFLLRGLFIADESLLHGW